MSIVHEDDFQDNNASPRLQLETLGWDANWAKQFGPFLEQGFEPARVTCEYREAYDVVGESGDLRAEISGRFRYEHPVHTEWPSVGDWAAITPRPEEGTATIHTVLPRRSWFSRKAAGDRTEEQIVAANVGIVFLVTSLDGDFNVPRIIVHTVHTVHIVHTRPCPPIPRPIAPPSQHDFQNNGRACYVSRTHG